MAEVLQGQAIAIVETKPSRNDYVDLFENSFEFDQFQLCSNPSVKRVLKRDVDIEFNPDDYDWVILVGSEPLKFYTKEGSITEYSGRIVDDKFLPVINPAMLAFKPEAKKTWEESRDNVFKYLNGEMKQEKLENIYGITESADLYVFLTRALEHENDFVALDSETSALYPRDGHMLGISMSYEPEHGAYIDCNCIDEKAEELLQLIFDKKRVVFHNAKFDIAFFEYHFGFKFPRFEDTMLMHYMLDEQPGTHGLKQLTLKHTPYGDYEKPMYQWIEDYRKRTGILKDSFSWDMIPFDIMKDYAAMDAVCTFLLFQKFEAALVKNEKMYSVYRDILIEGCRFLIDAQDYGVPFNKDRLMKSTALMQKEIDEAVEKLYTYPAVKMFEDAQGKDFNPNSTVQLRGLLFDFLQLTPTGKKTGTGANSTDAEVLGKLAEVHEIPKLVLDIRQKVKIKSTYLDKIYPQLDRDSRLRTNFNLHGTTSGRLSSSGKMNMQQIPRDNPIVKGCIKAKEGNKIVAMDLTTAEVYCAAVLANDKALMKVFQDGGNFHSQIAKLVFNLPGTVEEVTEHYSTERQMAKAVTFGIMYGAGPKKISEQVSKDSGKYFSTTEAKEVIDDYFAQFHGLKSWLDKSKQFIQDNGFIYSYFGRKRRLPNVFSEDKGIAAHEVRSGINFLVQSIASDVNLLGAIDSHKEVKERGMRAQIFALVHDSILAEVDEEEVEDYCEVVRRNVQKDRGLSIPGTPIGCDFDIGDDYSFGKFESKYGEL
jgi:DNA polymerase I-like protein with 3'-5' exonuclease and polymerase domains|tara:strand:+ start:746 stop:3031 length:2286 start_codon:yes stop_codon:yes gene_type:complete